jgi:hypothetical protein
MDDRLHILHWFEFASDDLDSAKILAKHGLRKVNAAKSTLLPKQLRLRVSRMNRKRAGRGKTRPFSPAWTI